MFREYETIFQDGEKMNLYTLPIESRFMWQQLEEGFTEIESRRFNQTQVLPNSTRKKSLLGNLLLIEKEAQNQRLANRTCSRNKRKIMSFILI